MPVCPLCSTVKCWETFELRIMRNMFQDDHLWLCVSSLLGDPHISRTDRLAWRNNCHCSCIRRPLVLHSSVVYYEMSHFYIVCYREEWTGGDVQGLQRHGGHTVFTGGQFSSTNTKINIVVVVVFFLLFYYPDIFFHTSKSKNSVNLIRPHRRKNTTKKCTIVLTSVVCFKQNSRDVQTTLNILCILSELLTVGEYSFYHR